MHAVKRDIPIPFALQDAHGLAAFAKDPIPRTKIAEAAISLRRLDACIRRLRFSDPVSGCYRLSDYFARRLESVADIGKKRQLPLLRRSSFELAFAPRKRPVDKRHRIIGEFCKEINHSLPDDLLHS